MRDMAVEELRFVRSGWNTKDLRKIWVHLGLRDVRWKGLIITEITKKKIVVGYHSKTKQKTEKTRSSLNGGARNNVSKIGKENWVSSLALFV